MRTSTLKLAMTLLLAAGLAAVARPTAGDEPPPARKAPAPRPPRPSPWGDEKGPFAYAGRVVGPDGKPVAGAKVYLLYRTTREVPVKARATSDAEGRFKFSVARAEFDRSETSAPWRSAKLVAVAPGYGLGISRPLSWPRESTLTLAKDDGPLRGRVLDLEGRPLAGVTVRVHGLYMPWGPGGASKDDLVNYVIGRNDGKGPPSTARGGPVLTLEGRGMKPDLGKLFPAAKTGADGRFSIPAVGNERIAELRIEGPTVVAQRVFARTWPGKTVRAEGSRLQPRPRRGVIVYGNGFDCIAAPCQPVVGVVRDKDSGKPIPGAVVTVSRIDRRPALSTDEPRAVADKEGRFRLLGLARGPGNYLLAGPPESEPYLDDEQPVPDRPGLDAVTVAFRLKRGVLITGRVLDKVTREPVLAHVRYGAFEDNPHHTDLRRGGHLVLQNRADDGTFRLVGVPGRGLLVADAMRDVWGGRPEQYLLGFGADRIKGLGPNGSFRTFPFPFNVRQSHTFAEVNIADGAKQVTCDLLLDPGPQLTVQILGPDGKPLTGVRVQGADYIMRYVPLPTGEVTVRGVGPGRPRLLQFDHARKNLAGSLVIRGDEKGPLTVKLAPAAVVTGRVVTQDGEPVTEGYITTALGSSRPGTGGGLDRGTLENWIRLDKDGKFRVTGLGPGVKYRFLLRKGASVHSLGGAGAGDLTFKPGETKDLGDVSVKLAE